MPNAFDAALRFLFGSTLLAMGTVPVFLALFGRVSTQGALVGALGACVGIYAVWTASKDSELLKQED